MARHRIERMRQLGPARAVGEPTDGGTSRDQHGARGRLGFVEHPGRVDLTELGRRLETWLGAKGFETEAIAADRKHVVKAEAPAGWKKTIGASPGLEVELTVAANGTNVHVRPGRAGGAVWTARYFTYSWIAFGVSFVSLKKEVQDFVRHEIQGHGMIVAAPEIVGIVETARSEQSLGSDERTIDNSDSDTTVTRTIRATKRWTQRCDVEIEKTRVNGQSIDLNVAELASLRGTMEETLRTSYAISAEVEQTFEEEVTLTVPPRTSLQVTMNWKRIVQEGYVRLRDSEKRMIDVPFEIAVGVTFDQRQLGTTAA
jgi:hypothetical protein